MTLKDIIGQQKALRILRGTLKRERIPSAFLFSGETGIGKRTTAVNYAKALNCLQPADNDCCDTCRSCKKIDVELHPDVSLILAENNEIRIDAIRRVTEILSLKPFEGRRKVIIIDDAETMNSSAANAFLKTLEEPPEESLIILVSSNPDRLPDTMRSRCMHLRFYPLSCDECQQVIGERVEGKEREATLKLAMGRPGLPISGNIVSEMERCIGMLTAMVQGETRDVWADRQEMKAWLDLSGLVLRDLAVSLVTQRKSDLLYEKGLRSDDLQTVLDTYTMIDRVKGLIDFNLNKSLTWNYIATVMGQCVRESGHSSNQGI